MRHKCFLKKKTLSSQLIEALWSLREVMVVGDKGTPQKNTDHEISCDSWYGSLHGTRNMIENDRQFEYTHSFSLLLKKKGVERENTLL